MSLYKGPTPRWERRFRRHLAIADVLAGRKLIVQRSGIDPGGIRRALDRHGRPDPRLDAIRWRLIDPKYIRFGKRDAPPAPVTSDAPAE